VTSDFRTSDRDVYTLPANGESAGSYTTDGRWNLGGWGTYPITYPLRDDAAAPSARERITRASP